ncbi:MAG: 5-carboxymethyl-2-hydroxymuconate delta-isomerase [Rhodocyclaceae bacterium]|nr:MAG: 5-carboxymethyl-2-hydroxymuconate delta-isomerase [Rhodocyclaceae bacterium]TND03172.1 MAG: 5-carboxymethyl-2-hydroxymuconate delta-isomerase [Rhodocyclaceae bacterium]
MKWLRFTSRGKSGFGTLDGNAIAIYSGDMFGVCSPTGEHVATADIEWLTPCVPGKMIGLWNNFRAAAEKNGNAIPPEPLYFIKGANSYCAHRQPIIAPRSHDGRVIYEGELAVVIGKAASGVSVADAPAHIFGYSCANDVTAPELLKRDESFTQWTRAKSFDTFGVFGPVIETDFDPAGGELATLLNGRERQRYAFADMIFAPAQLVSLISQDMTLLPGDVILCGTSLGAMPMKPGSTVEVVIEGVGILVNEYRAAP